VLQQAFGLRGVRDPSVELSDLFSASRVQTWGHRLRPSSTWWISEAEADVLAEPDERHAFGS
jgi:hypothetical protein